VVIINADKVIMSRDKMRTKRVYRHSGYPGGLSSESYGEFHDRKPADAVRHTIKGMLPHGPLGRAQISKLKVYAGADHPHTAQAPKPLTIR
jgi:large subunit ribosomal protein L13